MKSMLDAFIEIYGSMELAGDKNEWAKLLVAFRNGWNAAFDDGEQAPHSQKLSYINFNAILEEKGCK
jgi:hypothetical protein